MKKTVYLGMIGDIMHPGLINIITEGAKYGDVMIGLFTDNPYLIINLFFHLITPVVSIAEIVFLSDRTYTKWENNLTVIPPFVYGAAYVGNILINGIGEWPDRNDWYSFLIWGYPAGILIFAVICLVTWLIGLLMRKLTMVRNR